MSSILASLDMSLDDLIAQKKTRNSTADARPAKKGGKNDAGGAGPVRGRQRNTNRRRNQPYSRPNNDNDAGMDVDDDDDAPPPKRDAGKKRSVVVKTQGKGKGGKKGSSILERLGSNDKSSNASSGVKVLVKNLKYDILEDDVRELFGTVGKVSKAEIVYDRSGRSKGIARVWFERRADAEKAIKQYDGRTLDGQPMQINLDQDSNVRQGLFGTALRDDSNVKFKVSFGDNGDEQKGRGGGAGNAGRRRRGGRGGNPRGNNAPAKTTEDLDNDMDTYMKDA